MASDPVRRSPISSAMYAPRPIAAGQGTLDELQRERFGRCGKPIMMPQQTGAGTNTMDATSQVRCAAADRTALKSALAEAHIVPLLMSLVQLTGKTEYLDRARPHISGAWDFLQAIPADLQATIRADLADTIANAAEQGRQIPNEPPEELFRRMVEVAAGQSVPDIYLPVFQEEAAFGGVDHRRVAWRHPPASERLEKFSAVVIGAGLSGIAMSVRLQQANIPHVLIEKNAEVGGTWLENIYPGCGVDTPCHFYSYAFEVNSDWTEYFAKRGEIRRIHPQVRGKIRETLNASVSPRRSCRPNTTRRRQRGWSARGDLTGRR